jgi:hypothetical protein
LRNFVAKRAKLQSSGNKALYFVVFEDRREISTEGGAKEGISGAMSLCKQVGLDLAPMGRRALDRMLEALVWFE